MIVVGIDFDDVVGDLSSCWLGKYNQDHNDVLLESDIKSWDIGSYTKIGNKMYDYLKVPNLYDYVFPIINSIWGVLQLKQMGYRTIFITASTPEQSGVKYEWLVKYGLISTRKDYFEALDKSLIVCDYLIDDNPENVISAYGQGIVFTKEWNKNLVGYPRVNNWEEVVKYFQEVSVE